MTVGVAPGSHVDEDTKNADGKATTEKGISSEKIILDENGKTVPAKDHLPVKHAVRESAKFVGHAINEEVANPDIKH